MIHIVNLKTYKKILFISPLILTLFLTSCTNKNETIETIETVETVESNEEIPENPSTDTNDGYKYRDEITELINKGKIFDVSAYLENTANDFTLNVVLKNDEITLKELDNIKVGLSVNKMGDESETIISDFNHSKNYWEIPLIDGKLDYRHEINISKDSNLLTDIDKELLIKHGSDLIFTIEIFVDENSPVKIHHYFLD